ncbi:MAG TPA: hypothetical protein VMK84_28575 [Streptosporangiaceae bacterium]|nr:hypothetical protein [Streptosporangiaceae bacterium]
MEIDLSTAAPPPPGRTVRQAETLAEITRVLCHATMHHEALGEPSDAYRVLCELSSAASRLPQLIAQVTRWYALEDAAGRIAVPEGQWQGRPAAAVTALQAEGDATIAAAERLRAALAEMTRVAAALAAEGDGND